MNKKITLTFTSFLIIFIFINSMNATNRNNSIKNLLLTSSDIPQGFQFGKIPNFAKKVFQNNPWMFNKSAIKKLSNKIYPGGNYRNIAKIHMTIIARKSKPFGDDIVCYILKFKNNNAARIEIKKINSYAVFNKDRAITICKDNIAIFLHVDNFNDFHYIQNMADKIEGKIKSL